jgi:hypothetical protein
LSALFSYSAQTKVLIFAPPLLWVQPLPPLSARETQLGPLVMSIAWVYTAYALFATFKRRRLKERLS